jgi:hypothetical protein
VLTVIDEEEDNYLMNQPCDEVGGHEAIRYKVYTNARNLECRTYKGCKKYLVKGWCGKELCLTEQK